MFSGGRSPYLTTRASPWSVGCTLDCQAVGAHPWPFGRNFCGRTVVVALNTALESGRWTVRLTAIGASDDREGASTKMSRGCPLPRGRSTHRVPTQAWAVNGPASDQELVSKDTPDAAPAAPHACVEADEQEDNARTAVSARTTRTRPSSS